MLLVITASLAAAGMLTTALAFQQIAILAKQGLNPVEAATNFLPQTVHGNSGNIAHGLSR